MSRNVTHEYRLAEQAAKDFNPGEQPDIGKLMRAAYTHGYAAALLSGDRRVPTNVVRFNHPESQLSRCSELLDELAKEMHARGMDNVIGGIGDLTIRVSVQSQ